MTSATAVLVIDLINDFSFEDGETLYRHALPAARATAGLIKRARRSSVPVIYVNDNFHRWHHSFQSTIDDVRTRSEMGAAIVELLQPSEDDYFILKPHRSAFYKTSIEVLLAELKVREIVLTGVTADLCIFFTANDAYMRGFDIVVPRECVAAVTSADKTRSLTHSP